MRSHRAPRLALWLLERFVPDSEALAGDLLEEFDRRRSAVWFWWQTLGAAGSAVLGGGAEIRPLRLVDLQPADALERSRHWTLRFPAVNLSGSPVAGVGGLGLVIFAGLATLFAPVVWWVLLSSALAGVAAGLVVIARRDGLVTGRLLESKVLPL